LEIGETIEEAAIRETHEESGVLVSLEDMSLRAILRFHREGQPEKSYEGIVYIAPYDGQRFHETEEMIPQLWDIQHIPYHTMRDGDIYWVPHVLYGKYVDCTIIFDADNTLIDYTIQVEDTLFFDIPPV
jgi:ADP-ribose pyrophosphatase YjhB (NUDIX family)